MIKRALLLVAMLVAAWSQLYAAGGQWRIHPKYVGSEAQNIVEMGGRIYYLVSNNLFCFDPETQENEAWNKQNYLSDVVIKNIYHNPDEDYIVVVYDNGNLDVIEADGHVRNLTEIKNASLNSSKIVNSVSFASGIFYAATDFGYVVYDADDWEVDESRIYRRASADNPDVSITVKMLAVARAGNYLVMANDTAFYSGSAAERHDALSSFNVTKASLGKSVQLFPVADGQLFVLTESRLYLASVTQTGVKLETLVRAKPETVQPTPDGFLVNFMAQGYYYTFDAQGGNGTKVDGGNELYCVAGDGSLWSVAEDGLHNSKAPESYYMPIGITMGNPFWMTYNAGKGMLYLTNTGTLGRMFDPERDPTVVNVYDGTRWTDVTPGPLLKNSGTYWLTFAPENDDEYYLGSWWNGVYKVRGTQVVQTYNWENSPMIHASDNYFCHAVTTLDRQGNLWVVQTANGVTPVMVLPSAKRRLDNVSASDWIDLEMTDVRSSKFSRILATKLNNYIIYSIGNYGPVLVWDYGGDPAGNVRKITHNSFVDQDNSTYEWDVIFDFAEDLNGLIWMASTSGVISFDPKLAFNSDFTINHIKVPRNDGTGLADYLLDGNQANCIAVDANNCKWIGTESQGLFYVSADGSQILRQFNVDNSPLLSNTIRDICCNEATGSIFITTGNGLIEYFPDSAGPAEGDMINVQAYPNPVRPDYGGNVTITGLRDNCLVKIADAAGNVVTQMRSHGGTAQWDARTPSGDRVKSGVYFVFASQGQSGASGAAVAKILIMR